MSCQTSQPRFARHAAGGVSVSPKLGFRFTSSAPRQAVVLFLVLLFFKDPFQDILPLHTCLVFSVCRLHLPIGGSAPLLSIPPLHLAAFLPQQLPAFSECSSRAAHGPAVVLIQKKPTPRTYLSRCSALARPCPCKASKKDSSVQTNDCSTQKAFFQTRHYR